MMRWLACGAALASLGVVVRADDTPEGKVYLSKNEGKDGVVVTHSGLQYKVLVAGDEGGQHPKPNEKCKCHYKGTTVDGQEFDSSYKRGTPATFAPNQVIAGWHEAMQLMVPGATWELTIPSKLAYKDQQRGRFIKPGSVLVFKLEMLSCAFAHPQAPAKHVAKRAHSDHADASRKRSKHKQPAEQSEDSAAPVALRHKSRKSADHKARAAKSDRKPRSGAEAGTLAELKALKKEMESMIAQGDKVSKADMKKLRRKYEQQKLARKKRAREGRAHHDKHIK